MVLLFSVTSLCKPYSVWIFFFLNFKMPGKSCSGMVVTMVVRSVMIGRYFSSSNSGTCCRVELGSVEGTSQWRFLALGDEKLSELWGHLPKLETRVREQIWQVGELFSSGLF